MERYTYKRLKDSMPEWKRKKDPILTRFFYRPVSFYVSSVCANHNVSANTVSFMSTFAAIFTCICFIIPDYILHIVGAILCNVWLLMDCIDGNLARGVKKQPFGAFADSMSSYLLVGLLCTSLGIASFYDGGILISPNTPWIIVIGAFASSSDSLMRLIYQKYINTEKELEERGILQSEKDIHKDIKQVRSFIVRVDEECGIGGILPSLILLATIFGFLDVVVIYCFCFYGLACVCSVVKYTKKAIMKARKYQKIFDEKTSSI